MCQEISLRAAAIRRSFSGYSSSSLAAVLPVPLPLAHRNGLLCEAIAVDPSPSVSHWVVARRPENPPTCPSETSLILDASRVAAATGTGTCFVPQQAIAFAESAACAERGAASGPTGCLFRQVRLLSTPWKRDRVVMATTISQLKLCLFIVKRIDFVQHISSTHSDICFCRMPDPLSHHETIFPLRGCRLTFPGGRNFHMGIVGRQGR